MLTLDKRAHNPRLTLASLVIRIGVAQLNEASHRRSVHFGDGLPVSSFSRRPVTVDSKEREDWAFSIPTPTKSGLMLMSIAADGDSNERILETIVIEAAELEQFDAGIAEVITSAQSDVVDPSTGDQRFNVRVLMLGVAALSEETSEAFGPVIRVNVRPHQQSLAIMGGFAEEPPDELVGDVPALVEGLTSALAAVRRTLTGPQECRLAYQVLPDGLADQLSSFLFFEISAPLGYLQNTNDVEQVEQEVLRGLDPSAWQIRTHYDGRRLRLFGKVGPLQAVWPAATTA
jgi:hypothetical protein